MYKIMEIWKDIDGYNGYYQVSNLGRIKRLPRLINNQLAKELIKVCPQNHRGYNRVQLIKNKLSKKIYSVHRLVMFAFKPESYFDGAEVNHKNGIKTDNRVENLEWVTKHQNEKHSLETGLKPKGSKCTNSLLDETQVIVIRDAIKNKIPGKSIADYFKISPATVSAINKKRNWAWL